MANISLNVGATSVNASLMTPTNIKDGSVTTSKLADGAVTANKIADGSVTAEKLNSDLKSAFTEKIGKNLYNPNDSEIVANAYINQDGTFTQNTAYETTGYIDVSEISQLVLSCSNGSSIVGALNRAYVFFDTNKNIISGGATSTSNVNEINVVGGAKYVRISHSNTANDFQIESGYVATTYEPFKITNYANADINTDRRVKAIQYMFGTISTADGSFVSSNTKIVTSEMVTFNPGDRIIVDTTIANAIVCFYESDGTYTGKLLLMNSKATSILEITKTKYIKFRLSYNDNRVIANFGNLLVNISVTESAQIKSEPFWKGKNALVFGDSITFGYQLFDSTWTQDISTSKPSEYCYMAEVCSRLGMTFTNLSAPGGTVAENLSDPARFPLVNRWNDATDAYDLVVVNCGSNDFQYAWTPFGEFEEFGITHNKNTFIGALQIVCEGLLEKYPKSSVMVITPIKRNQSGLYGRKTNAIGKTLEDYCDAIKDICKYYGIYAVDANSQAGINPMIVSDRIYFNEETNESGYFYTHPNLLGHYTLSDFITAAINNYKMG